MFVSDPCTDQLSAGAPLSIESFKLSLDEVRIGVEHVSVVTSGFDDRDDSRFVIDATFVGLARPCGEQDRSALEQLLIADQWVELSWDNGRLVLARGTQSLLAVPSQ